MPKQKVFFIVIFTVLSLLAFQVPISKIIGSSQSFTLFELIAPIGGMFLGPLLGGVSAFFVRAIDIVYKHQTLDLLTVIRFLPAMLAAVYFGMKSKKSAIIFPICIALFLLNPIGRQAWLYSIIWLIPFTATLLGKKRLILNSLGATMTAHAVGSTIFLYTFGLTPAIWLGLIPVVFIERGIFTVGIWGSYILMNALLNSLAKIEKAKVLKRFVNEEYLPSLKFLKSRA
jgi:hypothetical protein